MKERGGKKLGCHTFFWSHKFHKIELFYFWNAVEKIWANFLRIMELLPKKLSLSSQKYGFWIREPGSEIRDPEKTYSGSRIQGSKRHRIPDPQHCNNGLHTFWVQTSRPFCLTPWWSVTGSRVLGSSAPLFRIRPPSNPSPPSKNTYADPYQTWCRSATKPGSHPGDQEAKRAMETHPRALEACQGATEANPGTMEVSECRPMLQSCNLHNLRQFNEDSDPHKKPDTYSHLKKPDPDTLKVKRRIRIRIRIKVKSRISNTAIKLKKFWASTLIRYLLSYRKNGPFEF